ncbi:MAG TPA: TetR/AcrR family transcriptional regulator [Pseudonocardiaceae bacterium]|jgi:AcrR family transcriptional regulator|nr:TetR/AcrR family transcriptional regulator [Pseudonocardiaceae bacterium]
MDHAEATTRLLDAAERLFYARGVQAVGMDEIRGASGVSLKRLYQCFPSKEELVVGYLRRRDLRWNAALAESVARTEDPVERLNAVFDWLREWFTEPGFRGCAFLNTFGELGEAPAIGAAVRAHKEALRTYLDGLVEDAGMPESLTDQLYLLVEGAIVTAAVTGNPDAAEQAKAVVAALLNH